jgi:hypothetical protein
LTDTPAQVGFLYRDSNGITSQAPGTEGRSGFLASGQPVNPGRIVRHRKNRMWPAMFQRELVGTVVPFATWRQTTRSAARRSQRQQLHQHRHSGERSHTPSQPFEQLRVRGHPSASLVRRALARVSDRTEFNTPRMDPKGDGEVTLLLTDVKRAKETKANNHAGTKH